MRTGPARGLFADIALLVIILAILGALYAIFAAPALLLLAWLL